MANYMRCLAVVMLFGVPCLVTAAGDDGTPVTFAKDIAPIFQEKCQNCHRAGQMAPMSLVTYEASLAHGPDDWHPEISERHFAE